MPTAYCFKCRQKREVKNPKQITLKNGRLAVRGTCPVCGTKVFRIFRDLDGKAPKTAGAQFSSSHN